MIEKLENLIKEIKYIKETTMWINKYTAAQKELSNYIKFFIEYLDMVPDNEARRFILLMDEFGISSKRKIKNDNLK